MAFICCPVKIKTQVKFFGWLELVGAIFMLVATIASFAMVATYIADSGDKEIGNSAIEIFNETRARYDRLYGPRTIVEAVPTPRADTTSEDYMYDDGVYSRRTYENLDDNTGDEDSNSTRDDISVEQPSYYFHYNINELEELYNQFVISGMSGQDVETEGKILRTRVMAFLGTIATGVTVVTLLNGIFTALLLVGAHQNKPGYMMPWLILSVLGLVGSIGMILFLVTVMPVLTSEIPSQFFTKYFIGIVIRLYVVFVAFRLWKQIRTSSHPQHTGLPISICLPGKNAKGDDEPLVVSMALPEECFNAKK